MADSALVPIGLYGAFALRYGTAFPLENLTSSCILFPALTVIGMIVILWLRLDRTKLNAFETNGVSRIGLAAIVLSACAITLSYLLNLSGPRSVPLIFGINFFFLSLTIRMVGLSLLRWLDDQSSHRIPVAIYGAGAAGIQLASALRQAQETRPVFFVDDNPSLTGLMISGLPVYRSTVQKT